MMEQIKVTDSPLDLEITAVPETPKVGIMDGIVVTLRRCLHCGWLLNKLLKDGTPGVCEICGR